MSVDASSSRAQMQWSVDSAGEPVARKRLCAAARTTRRMFVEGAKVHTTDAVRAASFLGIPSCNALRPLLFVVKVPLCRLSSSMSTHTQVQTAAGSAVC